MQRYLISYEFTDGEDQEEGGEMLINWYESGGPQNRPRKLRSAFVDFHGPKWHWSFRCKCRFLRNNMETVASLEKANGY